jgi:Tfp pilus assembly protein FimT
MEARVTRNKRKARRNPQHDGFTMLQAVIVLAVAMIISAATVVSIRASRPAIQLANSAHQLASYLERARADSVRRRAQSGSESSVQIINSTTYRVTMGWGGSGVLSSRDFTLEGDVVFDTNLTTIAFDWRGRPTNGAEVTLAMSNSSGSTQVDVTGSGDVTVGSDIFQDDAIPTVALNANVTGDVSPDPMDPHAAPSETATPPIIEEDPTPTPPAGGGDTDPTPTPTVSPTATPVASPTPTPSGNPNGTPTPTPTPTSPEVSGCVTSTSPSFLSISKNGGSGTVIVKVSNGSGSISASGPGNLTISPESQTISPSGSNVFSITSNNTTRGEFTVTFTAPCGSATVFVTVTN